MREADSGREIESLKRYTLDNRRLYCLQRAAVALYPKQALAYLYRSCGSAIEEFLSKRLRRPAAQVRVLVSVVHQEEGSCREAVMECHEDLSIPGIIAGRSSSANFAPLIAAAASALAIGTSMWCLQDTRDEVCMSCRHGASQDSPDLPRWCWRLEVEEGCAHQRFGSTCIPASRLGLRRKSCPPGLLCRGHFFRFPVHCRMTRRDAVIPQPTPAL